eukprot:gene20622-24157_t
MWWVTKVVLACICVTAGKNGCVRAARTIEVGTFEELQSALDSCESGNGTEDDITVIITDKIVVESMDMGQCTFPEMLPAQTQWHIRKQQADKFCTCGEGKDGKEGGSGTNVSLITGIVAILWIVVLFVGGKMVARKRAVAAVAQANALSISADAGNGGSGGSDDDGEGTSSDAAQLLSNPNSSTTANAAFDPSGHTSQGADVSSA